ncbi:MAG TPA: glycosyltransferase family 39 protein [Blastocatellia bacterium]
MKSDSAQSISEDGSITSKQLLLIFAAIFILNLLLRAFYLRFDFVNGDEGVRALTATRMLEGARLYADIVTDKPPGTTLFYAAVFALVGRSMTAVHLAAMVWNFATAVVLYFTTARLYSKREGLWAALMLVYFSTNYLTQDMMAANTEMLMALPLAASFYFFIRACGESRSSTMWLLLAGATTGAATLFKQVGIFNLAFFVAHEILSAYWSRSPERTKRLAWLIAGARRSFARLLWIAAGFIIVIGSFVLWLAAKGALDDFWRYAIELNFFYIGSMPRRLWLEFMIGRTLSYVAFNAALWILAAWTVARAIRNKERADERRRADLMVALWGAASLAAVFPGGRFFGHYFIQVLPALCLLASRGAETLRLRLSDRLQRRRARIAIASLVILTLISFVRFHQRTAILAFETITGARTLWSEKWGMSEREREAEVVSAFVRSRLSEGEPLYIWDYALDVYWRTGCQPASRYLSPYYITGKFTDSGQEEADPDIAFWRENRARLIEDLKRTRPRIILDVFGKLLELPYPEITEFMEKNYRYAGKVGLNSWRRFLVYELKENDD